MHGIRNTAVQMYKPRTRSEQFAISRLAVVVVVYSLSSLGGVSPIFSGGGGGVSSGAGIFSSESPDPRLSCMGPLRPLTDVVHSGTQYLSRVHRQSPDLPESPRA